MLPGAKTNSESTYNFLGPIDTLNLSICIILDVSLDFPIIILKLSILI